MEEQSNKEAQEGWLFAASATSISEEMAGDEDRKHTSGHKPRSGCGSRRRGDVVDSRK